MSLGGGGRGGAVAKRGGPWVPAASWFQSECVCCSGHSGALGTACVLLPSKTTRLR